MKKSKVLRAARRLIRENGLINMTLATLCYELEIPTGSFMHHTGMKFHELVSELRFSDKSSRIHSPIKLRVQKDARKDHILKHAIKLAEQSGYIWVTRDELANAAEISASLVTFHFHSIRDLRDEIMQHAIEQENLKILAQGLANSDPTALRAPFHMKKAAIRYLGSVS